MMLPGLNRRIAAFCKLGEIMLDACSDNPGSGDARKLREIAESQTKKNPWFTPKYVLKSINALAQDLNETKLHHWLDIYRIPENTINPRSIGLIMAGNIPLVGFHDFLSVLITGHRLIGKTSYKDSDLILEISRILTTVEPGMKDSIQLINKDIITSDAIIATGSDNSSRYFEYHYGSLPHIFRKNRNGIAIIDGDTKDTELYNLGSDLFDYFGLGCRSVSKIYLPEGFNIERLKSAWECFSVHLDITPYLNNYNYYRALYSMEKPEYHDLGHIILRRDTRFSSPISVLYYDYYNDASDVKNEIENKSEKIQVVIGKGFTGFGKAQSPKLNDYADGIDTIEFLMSL